MFMILTKAATTTGADRFCEAASGLFSLLGIAVTVIKIAIPIILIIMGMLDMGKAVTSGKDDEIKKQVIVFLKRAIAAVLVFFVPSIVGLIMQMVNEATSQDTCGYSACIKDITGVEGNC